MVTMDDGMILVRAPEREGARRALAAAQAIFAAARTDPEAACMAYFERDMVSIVRQRPVTEETRALAAIWDAARDAVALAWPEAELELLAIYRRVQEDGHYPEDVDANEG